MAGATRLELAAFCVTGRCYNQLNYAPNIWPSSPIIGKSNLAGQENILEFTSIQRKGSKFLKLNRSIKEYNPTTIEG